MSELPQPTRTRRELIGGAVYTAAELFAGGFGAKSVYDAKNLQNNIPRLTDDATQEDSAEDSTHGTYEKRLHEKVGDGYLNGILGFALSATMLFGHAMYIFRTRQLRRREKRLSKEQHLASQEVFAASHVESPQRGQMS